MNAEQGVSLEQQKSHFELYSEISWGVRKDTSVLNEYAEAVRPWNENRLAHFQALLDEHHARPGVNIRYPSDEVIWYPEDRASYAQLEEQWWQAADNLRITDAYNRPLKNEYWPKWKQDNSVIKSKIAFCERQRNILLTLHNDRPARATHAVPLSEPSSTTFLRYYIAEAQGKEMPQDYMLAAYNWHRMAMRLRGEGAKQLVGEAVETVASKVGLRRTTSHS